MSCSAQNINASTTTNRYIVGPTAELRLPFGLGVEVDVLYRHFSYNSSGVIGTIAGNLTNLDTTSGSWEFPILAKYRFKGKIVHPFVSAGVAWDTLSGLTQTVTSVVNNVTKTTSTSSPAELANTTTRGFVLGGGRRRESAGDPHRAGGTLHAMGRETVHRPDRLVQQQAESGGVSGRDYGSFNRRSETASQTAVSRPAFGS